MFALQAATLSLTGPLIALVGCVLFLVVLLAAFPGSSWPGLALALSLIPVAFWVGCRGIRAADDDAADRLGGDVVALDGVDLELRPGEVHCLVGPNGSGKTTLLDLLLGLTPPTSGTVTVPDVALGCSFQSPTVYPGLTVTENLDVFARLSGCPAPEWRERLCSVLGLDRVADQLAGTLSGGWQQKLDLALGFLKRPDYLLLDEPFSELDDASRRRLVDFLTQYCDDDRSVLIVTHHVRRFEGIVDRLTVFDGGAVRYDGSVSPDETAHDRYLTVLGPE